MPTAREMGEGSASRPGHSLPRERPGTHTGQILTNQDISDTTNAIFSAGSSCYQTLLN